MRLDELLSLKGKVAVVTGASSGLGITFASALAEAGANLELAARRMDRLEGVAREVRHLNIKARPFQCDVSKPDEVNGLVEDTLKNFGRLDILVNNAGV